jgi:alkylation response protein AidB-like acyl-CoA dehydrogenase
MLLARTDSDAPKHRGLTYLALDMTSPGVEVRPLKQMTGDTLYAEVFLTDVIVRAETVIGREGDGWSVAMTTLASERLALGAESALRFALSPAAGRRKPTERDLTAAELIARPAPPEPESASGGAMVGRGMDALLELAAKTGRDADPHVRQALARLYTLDRANAWNALRAKSSARAGRPIGPEASLGKLMASRIARAWRDAATAIAGCDAILDGADAPLDGLLARQFLFAPAPSLYGGTDQIQRNILGERVLGLPREPDPSRDVPFRELKRAAATPTADTGPSPTDRAGSS